MALLKECLTEAGRLVTEIEADIHQQPMEIHTPAQPFKLFHIFNPIVDEGKLAECFRKLYESYFGLQRTRMLEGECDELTFAAYLFLLVEQEHLGKNDFALHAKRPFYDFICTRVISTPQKTSRTFHNRLEMLKPLRQSLANPFQLEEVERRWKRNDNYKNFHCLLENFHGTHCCHELDRLK